MTTTITVAAADREGERARVDGDANVTALVQAVEDVGYTTHA